MATPVATLPSLSDVLETFDLIGVGLGIADSAGRLLLMNRVAEEILAERDGLEVTPARTLRMVRARGTASHGLLEPLLGDEGPNGGEERARVLAVPRTPGRRPLTVLVRNAGTSGEQADVNSPATFVFIVDPELQMKGMQTHLRQAYRLTPAETELATLLMHGNDLQECCRRMGVRRSTAASHLQRLFNKTQVRTQGQLVSVLFRRFGLLGLTRSVPLGSTTATPPPGKSTEALVGSFIRT
jgi:DNA-binding CsgD family transcriptional regulator